MGFDHNRRYEGTDSWRVKGARFIQYLTTRDRECWGFFAAGVVIAIILA